MNAIDLVSWIALVVTALWVLLAKDPTDSPEAPPPGLTGRSLSPRADAGNPSRGGGIPKAERLRLERLL